jgi:hypothetical protein
MARIVDNLAALRVIWLLATPFEKFDAFKLGLIDANGNKLKKAETSEEKNSTSMLHRLVWNLKRIINLVPGGKSRIGSLVAAYLLVKEAAENDYEEMQLEEEILAKFQIYRNVHFLEEEVIVEEALEALFEDAPANATGAAVSTDAPAIRPKKVKRKFASFDVDDDTFSKFQNGKAKFRKWNAYLNLEDDSHKEIHTYARKNPRGILVIKDTKGNMKGVRYSRTGGGNWHNVKRKSTVNESFQEEYLTIESLA